MKKETLNKISISCSDDFIKTYFPETHKASTVSKQPKLKKGGTGIALSIINDIKKSGKK